MVLGLAAGSSYHEPVLGALCPLCVLQRLHRPIEAAKSQGSSIEALT